MNFTSRFSEALSLAATLHADQQRKVSDVPYLAHLLAVAAPEPQRCQQPRTHGAAWWDACQLCAAQMSLF